MPGRTANHYSYLEAALALVALALVALALVALALAAAKALALV